MKESHAGWENTSKDKVSITYQFASGEKKTADGSVNERGEVILGATNKEGAQPKLPSEEERENAPAILKGSKSNLKGTSEPPKTENIGERIAGKYKYDSSSGTDTITINADGTFMNDTKGWGGTWQATSGADPVITFKSPFRHSFDLVETGFRLIDGNKLVGNYYGRETTMTRTR